MCVCEYMHVCVCVRALVCEPGGRPWRPEVPGGATVC